jgi:GT2 family glycosyltransferase
MTQAPPFFTVLTVLDSASDSTIADTIASIDAQDGDFALVLIDLGASDEARHVADDASANSARISVYTPADPVTPIAAYNDVLAEAAGTYVVMLPSGHTLSPGALTLVRREAEDGAPDLLYGNEDGHALPAWSPERLRWRQYLGAVLFLRTESVRAAGGLKAEFGDAALHDLLLRLTEKQASVRYLEAVLSAGYAAKASERADTEDTDLRWALARHAVSAHLERIGIAATCELGAAPGIVRVVRQLPETVAVSLIIPTRGSRGLVFGEERYYVVEALRSALAKTNHTNLEVVVVYDTGTPQDVLDELRAFVGDQLVLVEYDKPFSFSEKCNLGVLACSGDVVVLLNDDVQADSEGWLEQLVAPLAEPEVGMTGAKLLYSDSTIQHAGHAYGGGHYRHPYLEAWRDDPGDDDELLVNRECSGVTAACAAVRRELYLEVGGLSEALPVNFNDVDFSGKLTHAGYRILWLSDVVLFHFEHKSRVPDVHPWEVELVNSRWRLAERSRDPYLPNYDLAGRRK